MILQKMIEICILTQFFIIFAVQDVKSRKISNFLILLGVCIEVAISSIFHDINFYLDLLENIMISILLIIVWIKRGVGGGDVKILLLYLLYTPSDSRFSLVNSVISDINDRAEFFLFILLLFLSTYICEGLTMRKTPEEPRQNRILAPFFLVGLILSLIF